MSKAEVIERAEKLEIKLDGDETVAQLEALIAEKMESDGEIDAGAESAVMRTRMNRGNRRRIERAINRFNDEIELLTKELDAQVYMTDEDGKRTGDAPVVTGLRYAKKEINAEVNALLAT